MRPARSRSRASSLTTTPASCPTAEGSSSRGATPRGDGPPGSPTSTARTRACCRCPRVASCAQSTFSSDGSSVVASCPDGAAPAATTPRRAQPTPDRRHRRRAGRAVGTDTRGRLYYRDREVGQVDRLLRLEPAGGPATPLAELAPRDRAGAFGVLDVTVAANGEAWAYTLLRRLSDLHVVHGHPLAGARGALSPPQSQSREPWPFVSFPCRSFVFLAPVVRRLVLPSVHVRRSLPFVHLLDRPTSAPCTETPRA